MANFPLANGNLRKPISSVLLLCQRESIFVDLMQINDKFHCQKSIIIHGVSAYERAERKEKSNFYFQKCLRLLTRECPLTGKCECRV